MATAYHWPTKAQPQHPIAIVPSKPCAWCGGAMAKRRDESRRNGALRQFCNRSCYRAWKTGKPPTATVTGAPQRVKPRSVRPEGMTPFQAGAWAAQLRRDPAAWVEFVRGWQAESTS